MNFSKIKPVLIPMSGTIAFAIFPALFLYFNNSSEANFSEIILPLLASLALGIGLYALSWVITRSQSKASILAVIVSAVLLNFIMIENVLLFLFDNLWYWHTIPIILFITLHICYIVWKKINEDISETISLVILIVSAGLIAFNAAMAIPDIIGKISAQSELSNSSEETDDQVNAYQEIMPNIYVLVWDEFASFNQMEKYYDYDNVELKEFFEENNFTNSYNTYNEYPSTDVVMTNIVNLDYLVDISDSGAEKKSLRHNGELFSLMSDYGYEVRKFTSNGFYGEDYLGSNSVSATTISGETLVDLFFNQTILNYFVNDNLLEKAQTEIDIVKFLSNPDNLTESNTFTLMHVVFPHEPFYFDENGNELSREHFTNWDNTDIYKGQYLYATDLMINQLEVIIENDPTAMILVMSDHGARASNANTFSIDFEDQKNVLNAFYYNGQDLSEYIDKSSLNTLLLMLNKVLGSDFEELEVNNNE